MHCQSFDPISNSNARVLILGSLPGTESLRQSKYYAKPGNSFWKIMGDLFGANPDLDYPVRLQQLITRRVALWDVCASAFRIGSLDTSIRNETIVLNDFRTFFQKHKQIELVCFNGKLAEKLFLKGSPDLGVSLSGIHFHVLPSTSPAHASLTYEKKLAAWREVLKPFMAN